RQGPGRGRVARCRGVLAQSLMGAFVVVLPAKGIEAPLLAGEVAAGRACGFGLESSVHPFMTTVLLGVRGLDELGVDAEANPPDGQAGQAAQGGGGEGHAVVGADDAWQAVLVKQPAEHGLAAGGFGGGQTLAGEQVAAEAVDDGEGVAVETVAGLEVTLEVGGPDVVGGEHGSQGPARMTGTGTAAPPGDEAVTLEEIAAGAARGPFPGRVLSRENTQQLLGTPGGMTVTGLEQSLHDNRRCFMRAGVWPAGPVAEPPETAGLIAGGPFVGGLAADAEPFAQLGHGDEVSLEVGDEFESLVHGGRLAPRHAGTSRGARSVTHVPGLKCYLCTWTVPDPLHL